MKRLTIIFFGLLLTAGNAVKAQLVINEIMQSNVECIMDDIKEFPDSWVELYNPTDAAINLKDYKIGVKDKEKKAWQLPDKTVEAKGYVVIYCDKEGKEDNRLHPDFRLESGKDGNLYLFKGGEIVDKLEGLAKMPAPDVAYGRKTDGADEWGYQLTPSPGKANTGEICNAKHILGAPVFSEKGRVGNTNVNLTLSLPDGAPEGAYITYTTNGSEPTAKSTKYTKAITINKTTAIRAKVFCDGWLSPVSSAQSYIFHPRKMSTPIFSVQTNKKYLDDSEIGLFANNHSKEDKKTHDWRRPVNIEMFTSEGAESTFNQLSETRIQGGASRANALKSMVFYANKRFDPDHKRFSYEFFPDQKPGVTEFKSFSLRDGGNDFGDLYFRDLIIQRTMASHVDLDWQAGHTAVLYINGEYMGMLNIRERSNEDNVYSNYNGLEDLDMVEIGHENIGGVDQFEEELKEGTAEFYENFKAFYSEKGHTLKEYEEWMDVDEYLNVAVMNFFYGNNDWPGNNTVFWRPNDDDTKSGLPKIWRVIVKDTDFGLGLYGKQNSYNMLDLLYHPEKHQGDAWAYTEPATRLLKNMLEDPDILNKLIDKCCIYMGDFMNGKGTGEIIELIKAEALDEFEAHRNKYNPWSWNNRGDITNNFNNAKKWAEGRPEQFYKQIGNQWNLGTPIPLTINKGLNEEVQTIVNGIEVKGSYFDGKYFKNRELKVEGIGQGQAVKGWHIKQVNSNNNVIEKDVDEPVYTFNMPDCKSLTLTALFSTSNGIETIATDKPEQATDVYDLNGRKVRTDSGSLDGLSKGIYIINGKKVIK